MIDPSGKITVNELQVSMGNAVNLFQKGLKIVSAVRRTVNYVNAALDLAQAFQTGGLVETIRAQVNQILGTWSTYQNAGNFVQSARLLDPAFWKEAAEALGRQAGPLVANMMTWHGDRILRKYARQKQTPFHWVIYMPTPAEAVIPNPPLWLPIDTMEIAEAPVGLKFGHGDQKGRLLGLGMRDDTSGAYLQFFRMDYHDPHRGPHKHDWYYRTERVKQYVFNFHVPLEQ
jgi:hypothetical protein